jgi:hypothetical protein
MADVFIDYKREDRAKAQALAQAIEAAGYSVWWDIALAPGMSFDRQLRDQIEQAKCHITLWSPLSVTSDWVRAEARLAIQLGTFLPVFIKKTALPPPFNVHNTLDLSDWTGDLSHRGFRQLVEGVAAKVGRAAHFDSAETASWGVAQAANVATAFQNFIETFPNSRFAPEAKRRLATATANAPRKGSVFLSYRRDDSQAVARLIFERLGAKVGPGNVFFDVDGIPIGVDFRDHMFEQLVKCSTLLAIVGRDWLGRKQDGAYRISEANDFVRQELELGFSSGLRVIPVLAGQASMPKPEQLPASLERFPFIQAAQLDLGRDYETHIAQLITAVSGETLTL